MKRMPLAALIVSALSLGACAGIPPSADEMAKVPVVRYGSPAPAGSKFVLHYPAGAALPVVASVNGSLLEKPAQASMDVAVKRDIYVYQQWVSFDGKIWQNGDRVMDNDFLITLPGETDGKAPGTMSARFDLKP
ncbi:MAG TPA: hypothetical protein VEB64_14480 [Azospirillaceae bacterium]|nr:hypothetical protein [Azospirillaceae bacterium]